MAEIFHFYRSFCKICIYILANRTENRQPLKFLNIIRRESSVVMIFDFPKIDYMDSFSSKMHKFSIFEQMTRCVRMCHALLSPEYLENAFNDFNKIP